MREAKKRNEKRGREEGMEWGGEEEEVGGKVYNNIYVI